jgi:2,5-dihydroxypyridine 5,6-dioxygenase
MLFVAEPPDVLERLMGSAALKESALRGGQKLRQGRRLHVSSSAGTDLSADISAPDLPITHQWGFVDEAGRWDHWPSGFIACFPRDRSAQGAIVLQPGDALLPFNRYVTDPVHLTIRDGFIVDLQGQGSDAANLRDYFDSWHDPDAWAVSHMGWGFHPFASWAALEVYDGRRLYGQELRSTAGNFMWSTGSNRFAGRHTPAHLDIPMRGCTVRIDDEPIVEQGRLGA